MAATLAARGARGAGPAGSVPRFLPALLLGALAWRGAGEVAERPSADVSSAETRNLLLVVVADLSAADLGCFGGSIAHTPRIDGFARVALRFNNAYAQSSSSAPSRSSMLTGVPPDALGVYDDTTHFRDQEGGASLVTLPQYLLRRGYRAVSYGRIFHGELNDPASWSSQRAFADNHTYRELRGAAWRAAGGAQYEGGENNYDAGPPRADEALRARPPCERSLSKPVDEYADERVVRAAVDAIGRLSAEEAPWAVSVGLSATALPYTAPDVEWQRMAAQPMGAADKRMASSGRAATTPRPRGLSAQAAAELERMLELRRFGGVPLLGPLSYAHAAELRHAFRAALLSVDRAFGALLDAVEAADKTEETVVVLVSDHGSKHAEYGGAWGGRTLLQRDVRVPLLLSDPGSVVHFLALGQRRDRDGGGTGGVSTDELVELVDLFPTLLSALGVPDWARDGALRAQLRGRDVSALLASAHGVLPPEQQLHAARAQAVGVMHDAACACMGYTLVAKPSHPALRTLRRAPVPQRGLVKLVHWLAPGASQCQAARGHNASAARVVTACAGSMDLYLLDSPRELERESIATSPRGAYIARGLVDEIERYAEAWTRAPRRRLCRYVGCGDVDLAPLARRRRVMVGKLARQGSAGAAVGARRVKGKPEPMAGPAARPGAKPDEQAIAQARWLAWKHITTHRHGYVQRNPRAARTPVPDDSELPSSPGWP